MTKKLYSFNLSKDIIEKLDEILTTKNLSRTAFIEDFILSYVNIYEERFASPKTKRCPDCGKYYGVVINCPCKRER